MPFWVGKEESRTEEVVWGEVLGKEDWVEGKIREEAVRGDEPDEQDRSKGKRGRILQVKRLRNHKNGTR